MDEDALAREIADLERDQRSSRVPQWDDVVNGRRDADHVVQELREQGHDPDELARAAELMAPLDSAFEEALTDRLLDPAATGIESAAPVVESAAPVIERTDRSWWRRGGVAAVAVAAVAAAVILLLLPPRGSDPEVTTIASLPAHEMWIEPVAATMRSAQEQTVRVPPGAALTFFLRPATTYTAQPRVWACLEGPQPQALAVQLDPPSPGRTLRGTVTLPRDLDPGEWMLMSVVDTREPPADPCAVQPDAGRRLQRTRFVVTEP